MYQQAVESSPEFVEPDTDAQPKTGEHLCPLWVGYLLSSPLRRLVDNPKKLMAPYVEPGMTVLDLGCAMGFFTIPLARMVGPSGRVVCVDVQERMLAVLRRRARRKELDDIVEARLCTQESLGLDDFRDRAHVALAFHVVHESQHPESFLADCYSALRPGGKLILVEPTAHVSDDLLEHIHELAVGAGFEKTTDLRIRGSRGAVFEK